MWRFSINNSIISIGFENSLQQLAIRLVAPDRAVPTKGRLFLSLDGAGGIGSYTIRIAVQQGIQVIALVKSGDLEAMRRLGASELIDDTGGDVVEVVRAAHPKKLDAVLDVLSNAAAGILHNSQTLRLINRLSTGSVRSMSPGRRGPGC